MRHVCCRPVHKSAAFCRRPCRRRGHILPTPGGAARCPCFHRGPPPLAVVLVTFTFCSAEHTSGMTPSSGLVAALQDCSLLALLFLRLPKLAPDLLLRVSLIFLANLFFRILCAHFYPLPGKLSSKDMGRLLFFLPDDNRRTATSLKHNSRQKQLTFDQ